MENCFGGLPDDVGGTAGEFEARWNGNGRGRGDNPYHSGRAASILFSSLFALRESTCISTISEFGHGEPLSLTLCSRAQPGRGRLCFCSDDEKLFFSGRTYRIDPPASSPSSSLRTVTPLKSHSPSSRTTAFRINSIKQLNTVFPNCAGASHCAVQYCTTATYLYT